VGVDSRGGKARLGGRDAFFDVLAERGLVAFERQQIISPVLQHQVARRVVLRVQRVQRHPTSDQCPLSEEFPRHRDFVGLGVHQGTAQIELAGDANRAQDRVARAGVGFLAVHDDQLLLGRAAPHFWLYLPEHRVDLAPSGLFKEAREGGLAGGGKAALRIAPEAHRAALGLGQAAGELGPIFWSARSLAQQGQQH
jgi:hypothetical protein